MRKRHVLLITTMLSAAIVAGASTAFAIGLAAPRLPVPPQMDTIISDVTVLNPGVGRTEHQSIVIKDGKVTAVRPVAPGDPAPACKGCIAMPGLIDAHVHTPPKLAFGNQELFALLHLAHGVTTVRDVGQIDSSLQKLVRRSNSGKVVGPRMLWCGTVLESTPISFGAARKVDTAAEATIAVDELAAQGVDCIKVYNNLAAEPYAAIRAGALKHGLPVIGHIPHRVGLKNTFDFEAQHFTGVPYVRGGATPSHSDFRDEDWLSMSDADISAALDVAKEHRVSFLPTLANGRLRLIASDPKRFQPTPAASYLPEIWRATWDSQTTVASHPVDDGIGRRLERLPRFNRVAQIAREKGIDVLAGTDTMMPWVVPGESLLLEIDDLAQAFGNNEAALASATSVNGRHLGAGAIGVIAPGARADILLMADDPARDLQALRRWTVLYADGRRYERAQVDSWLQTYKRHFHTGFYRFVMGKAAGLAASGKGRAPIHDH